MTQQQDERPRQRLERLQRLQHVGSGSSIILPLLYPAPGALQECVAGVQERYIACSSVAGPGTSSNWTRQHHARAWQQLYRSRQHTRARRQHCPPIASSCSGQEFAAVLQQFWSNFAAVLQPDVAVVAVTLRVGVLSGGLEWGS